jgi:hypothetical protein
MPRTGSTYPAGADAEADRDQDEPCDEDGNRKRADAGAISLDRSRPGRLARSSCGMARLERSDQCARGALTPGPGLARTGRGGRADRPGKVLAGPRLDSLTEGRAGSIRPQLGRSRPSSGSSVARASAAGGAAVVGGRRLLGLRRRRFGRRRRVGRRRGFRLFRGSWRVLRTLGHIGFVGLRLFVRHLDIGGRRLRRLRGRRGRAGRPDRSEEDGEDESRSLPHGQSSSSAFRRPTRPNASARASPLAGPDGRRAEDGSLPGARAS